MSAAALSLAVVALAWCAGLTAHLAAGRRRGWHRGIYSGGERR